MHVRSQTLKLQREGDEIMNFYNQVAPNQIADFIADDSEQIRKLEMLVKGELTFPSDAKKSIILHGRYGTGKTVLAKLLARMIEENREADFDAASFRDQVWFFSCGKLDQSEVIREATKATRSLFGSGRRYFILDEVDNFRGDTQRSLKSLITENDNIIFIMTTNHRDKVDSGLKSRSHLISFENPSVEQWLKRCVEILQKYSVTPDERYLKDLIKRNRCDARNILSALEETIALAA